MSETKRKKAAPKRVALTEKLTTTDSIDTTADVATKVENSKNTAVLSRLLKNMRGNPQQLIFNKIVVAYGMIEVCGREEDGLFVWSDDTRTKLYLTEVDTKRLLCGLETGVWTWAK